MKKIILPAVALLALVLVWIFFRVPASSQSINLLSPQGSEVWEIGSEQVIRWTSKNLPETYQIAINLRRVVLADEGIEGQEFDPVLFVGLQNTGQVDWKITDNYPEGDYFIDIVAYESLPITDEAISMESKNSFRLAYPQVNENWLNYKNEEFGYSLNYPNHLFVREFPDTKDGADFFLSEDDLAACITVSARVSSGQGDRPLEEYVEVAAIEEIQGFEKLNSLELVTSASGVVGYKTTWIYRVLAQPEQISLPITYFAGPGLVQDMNYKSIQVTLNDLECKNIYEQMILTFSN